MMLPLPLLMTAEKAVAALLRMDPDTQARLSALDGKVMRVNVDSPQLSIIVSITDAQVMLDQPPDSDDEDLLVDATVSGSLSDLRSLIYGNDAVYTGAVTIEGDIGVSQHLKQIVAQFDPDWQEAVSPYLGDGLTHRLDVAQSGFVHWLKRTREALKLNTGEYLQEEVELLAADSLIESFCDEVDEVRSAADRLEARIRQLEAGLERQSRHRSDGADSC